MANTKVTDMAEATAGTAVVLYAVQSGDKKVTVAANLHDFLSAADYAAARTALGLTTLATTTPGTDVATALAIAAIGASGGLTRGTGATHTTPTLSGIRTLTGTKVITASAMVALAIDVTQMLNTKTISADSTFTFSGTPGATNQWFGMYVINDQGTAKTLTIPSSFSMGRQGAITSIIIPANGELYLVWRYNGSAYRLFGDPPLTSGTGSFALTTSPSFTTPDLGTPSAVVLTNGTGLPASGIAAGVLGATITLGESTGNIALDAALSADGTWSGITEAGTAGATLAFGDLVYYAPADSRWELADASAASTSGHVKLGICVLAAAANGDPTNILLVGKVRADAAFPALSVGDPVYVSETAGDITDAQPTTEDAVIRVIGFANTADELYFNPSPDYITYTV